MCRNPTLILEGATPHPPHRHDDYRSTIYKALSRTTGNAAWYLRRHGFDIACGVIFVTAFGLAIATAQPRDAGFAPHVKALVTSAVRG